MLSLGAPRFAWAAGMTLEQIKKSGELRIGCEATYPPFTFRQGGVLAGYDVDLATAFCKNLGVKPVFIDTVWAGVIPALYAKKFDLVMSSLSYTAEREKHVAYTIPYVQASQGMLIRASDAKTIVSMTQMNGKILGIKAGSPGQIMAPGIDAALKAAGGTGFKQVKEFDDHPAAYIALAENRVDGVLNTLPTLGLAIKNAPGKFAVVKGIGKENWAGIAARPEDTALTEYLDKQILQFKKDGTLLALQQKWFGFEMNLPDTIPNLT